MTKMEQIILVDCKIEDTKLTLYLRDKKGNVCVWEIPLDEPIRGYNSHSVKALKSTIYPLAYEKYTDCDERNVIFSLVWYLYRDKKSTWVWVHYGFINRLNSKYEW